MARIVWDRRENIQNAIRLIPPVVAKSRKDFRPPPTIEDDFRRQLEHDVPYVNFTYELVRDWFSVKEEGYEPIYLRGQQTPIDWKSKIGNSDMNSNFKTTHDIPLHKGDMVIREDGKVYILNWEIQNHANNQATQTAECNGTLTFVRHINDIVSVEGYLIEPRHDAIIVPPIPVIHEEYAGRPDFSATREIPGINADHLITVSMQWNSRTKNIRLDDEFEIGCFTYRVINISFAEVNIDNENGILKINAKRVAGGVIEDGEM